MQKHLVSINDLPPGGKEFELDDQEIWLEPIKHFNMDCKILKPLHCTIFVQPVDEGVLVRGNLQGQISLPCNRCAEDAIENINAEFSEYEEIPEQNHFSKQDASDSCIVFQMNAPMLDLGAIAWEQFMLAQPTQPLCKEDCLGLCPSCGQNLNLGSCACAEDQGDPRLAALKNVKIAK